MKNNFTSARLSALSWACLCAISSNAWAQSGAENTLRETVVTATRVEQPLTDVVADVSIVGRDAIEASGANGLADLLARLPGVSIARSGGPASTTSVFLRGAENRFTAVFVDGIRLDSQSTGGASWNAIPLSQVERIEVLRGPAAAVYGSDALGGVVQVFTRKGEDGPSRSVEVGLGTHGTAKLDMSLSGAAQGWDYAFGLNRELSDGYNIQRSANPDKDGYRNTALSGRVGFQLAPGQKLDATLLRSRVDAQYDGYMPGQDDHAVSDVQAVGLNWSARWSDLYSTQVSVNRGTDRYESRPSAYVTDTQVTSYLLQNVWRIGSQTLTAALERREDELLNGSTTPVNTDRSQNALALGYGVRSGAHTLQLNVRGDNDSEFGNHTTGSIAYGYALTPAWSVTASTGTAFRAPTLFQRFSIYGDASLQPEKAHNTEVGLKYAAQSTRLSAVLYSNRVSDMINYVSGPGACINGVGMYAGCYGNTGRAQLDGLTLSAATRWMGVNWGGSVDLLNPKNEITGKLLQRRAKHAAMLTADTQWLGMKLGAEWQMVGKRYDDAANKNVMGGYGLLNLYLSAPVAKNWTVVARVDNLADKFYQTARGYDTPGRTLYVGLRWTDR